MAKRIHEPGSGLSTGDAALIALKEQIEQRIEHAQREARDLRAAPEQVELRATREQEQLGSVAPLVDR